MKLLNTDYTAFSALDISSEVTVPTGVSGYILNSVPVRLGGCIIVTGCATGSTLTVKIYNAVAVNQKALLHSFALTESLGAAYHYIGYFNSVFHIPKTGLSTAILITLTSNAADTNASGNLYVYDLDKSLDIATVNEATPVSAEDVGDELDARALSTDTQGTLGYLLKRLMGKR